MNNIPLEESLPYRLLALVVLGVFYSTYFVKRWAQKHRGIQPMHIGCRKEAQTHTVETLMGVATVGIVPAQLLSVGFEWSHLPAGARFTGFCVGVMLMYCNVLTAGFTVFASTMLHLQILQEERYLTAAFGEEYLTYRRKVFRYLGRRKEEKR